MADVLINHPLFGSMWLSNARIVPEYSHGVIVRKHIVGEAWDDSDVGSGLLPDDYQGQPVTMNFPITCIRKDPGGILAEDGRA